MKNANAGGHLEIRPHDWCDSFDCMHWFARNSERHICTLDRILSDREKCLFMIVDINVMKDRCKCPTNEGLRTFLNCCPLNLMNLTDTANSTRLGFTPRSFSIKNHANSPWNALDPHKIAGLCCNQLKLQLSPRLTQCRSVSRESRAKLKQVAHL
jgi:hypothetical protein